MCRWGQARYIAVRLECRERHNNRRCEVLAMGDKLESNESREVGALSIMWLIVTMLMTAGFAVGVSLLI